MPKLKPVVKLIYIHKSTCTVQFWAVARVSTLKRNLFPLLIVPKLVAVDPSYAPLDKVTVPIVVGVNTPVPLDCSNFT